MARMAEPGMEAKDAALTQDAAAQKIQAVARRLRARRRRGAAKDALREGGGPLLFGLPRKRMDLRLHELPPFTLMASRTYLALAVKRSSLAAYFGLRPGDRLEKVAGRDASELDPRALRSALAAERVELAFARRSLEDAEEVASIRIQATWRGHRQRGGPVADAANPSGEVSATIGPSRKKLKEKATPSTLIPGSRVQASWPSELQQLRFYEFPPHHHLLSRVFMIYKVMSPQPLCFGDLLLSVDAQKASDLDASTLSHMLGSGESLQLTFVRGSPEDREEIAAIRIQSAFRARRGRKDRNWVQWLLEGLRPLYVLPGLAHLQQRLQKKTMAPRLARRQLQKSQGEAFLATPTGGDSLLELQAEFGIKTRASGRSLDKAFCASCWRRRRPSSRTGFKVSRSGWRGLTGSSGRVRLEWKEQDWRLFKASKGLRNEDSIGKWPLDMVEVFSNQKYRFYLGSISSALKFDERYKLDFVFTMNADDARRDGEPEDWLAFFRERNVTNFRFSDFDTTNVEPGTPKWLQKKEEFLKIWSAVVESLRQNTSESGEQVQILFHCFGGVIRSTAALVAALISLSMSTEEAIEHVLKARAGQEYWRRRDYFIEALLEFEAQCGGLAPATQPK
eukprot:s4186_g1.t1